MTARQEISARTMIQLRVTTMLHGKYKQALDSVYIHEADVEEVLEILLEAEEKIKALKK